MGARHAGLRAVICSAGFALLLAPTTALGQTPASPQAETESPAPESPAPESPAPESPAPESEPSDVAASETPAETAPAQSAAEPEPQPEPKPEAPPAPAPAEKTPAPAATSEEQKPLVEDDYEGATDAALVEEEPGPKNLSLGVALDLTVPLGKTSDFIGSASIQGLSLDLRYYAWGNIGIGAGVALDSLSKKSTETATWENAAITGTQVRELSYTPITLKGYYAWREQQRLIPYVAAGLGAARAVKRLTAGISSLAEASWHFAIVPEAGLQIPVGPTLILTNVRLNYLPPSAGVPEHLFANLSLGLSIQ